MPQQIQDNPGTWKTQGGGPAMTLWAVSEGQQAPSYPAPSWLPDKAMGVPKLPTQSFFSWLGPWVCPGFCTCWASILPPSCALALWAGGGGGSTLLCSHVPFCEAGTYTSPGEIGVGLRADLWREGPYERNVTSPQLGPKRMPKAATISTPSGVQQWKPLGSLCSWSDTGEPHPLSPHSKLLTPLLVRNLEVRLTKETEAHGDLL